MPASDGGDAPRQPRAPGVVRCCVEPSGPRIQMVSCTSILLRSAPTAPPFCQAPTADADLRVSVSSYSRRHWTDVHVYIRSVATPRRGASVRAHSPVGRVATAHL